MPTPVSAQSPQFRMPSDAVHGRSKAKMKTLIIATRSAAAHTGHGCPKTSRYCGLNRRAIARDSTGRPRPELQNNLAQATPVVAKRVKGWAREGALEAPSNFISKRIDQPPSAPPLLTSAINSRLHDVQAGHHLVHRLHQLVHVVDGSTQRFGDRRLLAPEVVVLATESAELELDLVKLPAHGRDLLAHPVALRVAGGRSLAEPLVVVEDTVHDASEEVLAFLDPALHLLPRANRAGPRHVHPQASSSRVGRPSRRPRGLPCAPQTTIRSRLSRTAASVGQHSEIPMVGEAPTGSPGKQRSSGDSDELARGQLGKKSIRAQSKRPWSDVSSTQCVCFSFSVFTSLITFSARNAGTSS